MPGYYFHVRNAGHLLDETGEGHRTIEGSESRARQIAYEFSEDLETYRGYSVVVARDDDKTIVRVPITPD